jgi:hypothetical protein
VEQELNFLKGLLIEFDPPLVFATPPPPATPQTKIGTWKEAISDKGKKYYWNTVTREVSWKNPNPNP